MAKANKFTSTACALLLAATAVSVQSAPVTLVGDTVSYVYDDSQGALALFGTPTIDGDIVRFVPPSFRAESLDGAGLDVATANFIFSSVYSHNGSDLAGIQVFEFGDYEITNGDAVSADVLLTASNNNDFTEVTSDQDSFNAAGGSTGLQTWTMSASIDPAAAFDSAANDILLTIQNTLTATTDAAGEASWIQKKLNFVAVSQVPIPAAGWLFGSALLGMVGIARRKARS